LGCGEDDDAGIVLHSILKVRQYDPVVNRYVKVSVNEQQVEALLDFNALENAVALKTVEDDPNLKMYDLSDGRKANSRWLHTVGMVWLPVVIGSKAEKLRCVVVDGLVEKLIIGLPGLSFLGASINFATGDVRISGCRGKKVERFTVAVKSDELHECQALVIDANMKCRESSPEGKNVCAKDQLSEQVKGLAGKVESRDVVVRGKDCRIKPNQEKKADPVSGRGKKEGRVNVVSPEQRKLPSINTTTTTIISPDHDDKRSEGESDSDDEDADESEELKQRSTGSTKVGKRVHKGKRKKGKKKKGSRRK